MAKKSKARKARKAMEERFKQHGPLSPRIDTPPKPEDHEWPPPWMKDGKPFQAVSGGLPTLGKRSR